MRLLLAEDEMELSRALAVILKHDGYTVDAVSNGEDALACLESGQYDGAIPDIMMPKMDGITVLKKIRAGKNRIPILLLTAKGEVDDRVERLSTLTHCAEQPVIRQLVSILVDNAVKYAEGCGKIQVELKKSGRRISLSVSNPVGQIRQKDLERMFDRFYRADISRNAQTGGHGIGLSVAKAIAESHAGEISAKEQGGRITVRVILTGNG